jgi:hypothetical protein
MGRRGMHIEYWWKIQKERRRPRRRWVENIKIYLREIGLIGVNWIDLARIGNSGGLFRTRQWAFGFHKMLGKFLNSCTAGGFSMELVVAVREMQIDLCVVAVCVECVYSGNSPDSRYVWRNCAQLKCSCVLGLRLL